MLDDLHELSEIPVFSSSHHISSNYDDLTFILSRSTNPKSKRRSQFHPHDAMAAVSDPQQVGRHTQPQHARTSHSIHPRSRASLFSAPLPTV
jgi:hypothetical protein